ncbi:MAG: Glutathione synthetase [Nitrospira sp.]|nr:Glutathione synthetase [Nitrospira sp.]
MLPLVSTLRLGVVMDPITTLKPEKDSSLAMILAAQRRGWDVRIMEPKDLFLLQGRAWGFMRKVRLSTDMIYDCGAVERSPLHELNVILMRKDPPVDQDFITATYLLEQAEREGVMVVNRPQALRDANEKIFASRFPECCPESLVSAAIPEILAFLYEHQCIVVKPLDQMAGRSVFVMDTQERNLNVILEEMTQRGRRFVQAQRYLSAVNESGDRRILLIDGEPIPYALVRHPKPGETRANLAAGGIPSGALLTERERWICDRIAPELKRRGLFFVGIDVIGGWLTEVNVTSPTGIRELDKYFKIEIAADFMIAIENQVRRKLVG